MVESLDFSKRVLNVYFLHIIIKSIFRVSLKFNVEQDDRICMGHFLDMRISNARQDLPNASQRNQPKLFQHYE